MNLTISTADEFPPLTLVVSRTSGTPDLTGAEDVNVLLYEDEILDADPVISETATAEEIRNGEIKLSYVWPAGMTEAIAAGVYAVVWTIKYDGDVDTSYGVTLSPQTLTIVEAPGAALPALPPAAGPVVELLNHSFEDSTDVGGGVLAPDEWTQDPGSGAEHAGVSFVTGAIAGGDGAHVLLGEATKPVLLSQTFSEWSALTSYTLTIWSGIPFVLAPSGGHFCRVIDGFGTIGEIDFAGAPVPPASAPAATLLEYSATFIAPAGTVGPITLELGGPAQDPAGQLVFDNVSLTVNEPDVLINGEIIEIDTPTKSLLARRLVQLDGVA